MPLDSLECGRQDSNLQRIYEGSPQPGGVQFRCVFRFRHARVRGGEGGRAMAPRKDRPSLVRRAPRRGLASSVCCSASLSPVHSLNRLWQSGSGLPFSLALLVSRVRVNVFRFKTKPFQEVIDSLPSKALGLVMPTDFMTRFALKFMNLGLH